MKIGYMACWDGINGGDLGLVHEAECMGCPKVSNRTERLGLGHPTLSHCSKSSLSILSPCTARWESRDTQQAYKSSLSIVSQCTTELESTA